VWTSNWSSDVCPAELAGLSND